MRLQTTISDHLELVLHKRSSDTGLTINELVRLAIVNSYVTPVFVAQEDKHEDEHSTG